MIDIFKTQTLEGFNTDVIRRGEVFYLEFEEEEEHGYIPPSSLRAKHIKGNVIISRCSLFELEFRTIYDLEESTMHKVCLLYTSPSPRDS